MMLQRQKWEMRMCVYDRVWETRGRVEQGKVEKERLQDGQDQVYAGLVLVLCLPRSVLLW